MEIHDRSRVRGSVLVLLGFLPPNVSVFRSKRRKGPTSLTFKEGSTHLVSTTSTGVRFSTSLFLTEDVERWKRGGTVIRVGWSQRRREVLGHGSSSTKTLYRSKNKTSLYVRSSRIQGIKNLCFNKFKVMTRGFLKIVDLIIIYRRTSLSL